MADINIPASGSVITSAQITNAFDAVRAEVNGMGQGQFDRMALGPQHLTSFLLAFDEVAVSSTTLVNTQPAPFNETQNPVTAGWQAIAAYLLNNGGGGYTINVPAQSAVTVRIKLTCYIGQHLDDGGGLTPIGTQAWLAVCWAVGGTAANRRKVWWSLDNELGTSDVEAFTHFGMGCHAPAFDITFRLENATGTPANQIINYVQVYGAINKGAAGAAGSFNLENGLMSLYVYPPEDI
jgi:hypothetical protein